MFMNCRLCKASIKSAIEFNATFIVKGSKITIMYEFFSEDSDIGPFVSKENL